MKRMRILNSLAVASLFAATAMPGAQAQQPVTGPLTLANSPLYVGVAARPRVMLTISRDEELFRKAYNDYTDLDGDGALETTYTHAIDYYGYFDATKCYNYDTTNHRFVPIALSPYDATAKKYTKYCDGVAGGRWSGNFLNWATMTRVDVVRKLLFGGLRATDDQTLTVLERSHLPQDAHGFAKYYNGSDISKVTPFSPATTAPTAATATQFTPAPGLKSNLAVATGSFALGDQVTLTRGSGASARTLVGTVTCVNGTGMQMLNGVSIASPGTGPVASSESCSGGTINVVVEQSNCMASSGCTSNEASWTIANNTRTGISICNTTVGASTGANALSQTNTNPPLMRVAAGNFMLWAANERMQCAWRDDSPSGSGTSYTSSNEDPNSQAINGSGGRTNGNRAGISGIFAGTLGASRSTNSQMIDAALGTGIAKGDYVVRVEACKSEALIGTEKCRAYPTTNATFPKGILKPVGMLQIYGQAWGGSGTQLIDFGLITGSYMKNFSGGVLRKNIGAMDDEIDLNTGVFNTAFWNDPSYRKSPGNIIGTLSRLRIWGYNYPGGPYSNPWYGPDNAGNGSYTGTAANGGDNCFFHGTTIKDGTCTSWGNPLSEIYYEALRYLAGGKTDSGTGSNNATADFYVNPADITGAWTAGGGGCANSNKDCMLGLALAQWQDSVNSTNYCAPLNALVFSASTSTSEMSYSGDVNNLTKSALASRSLGSINAASTNAAALTTSLGTLEGITGNSFFVGRTGAGSNLLCDAKTISALGDISGICPEAPTKGGSYLIAGLAYQAHTKPIRSDYTVPSTAPDSLKVNTYGVTLSTNAPRIPLQFSGESTPRGYLQPTYRVQKWDMDPPYKGRVLGGTLVEFRVVSQSATADKVEGVLYASWEDSERGGDFDQDVWGLIRYCMQKSGGQCLDANGNTVPEANSITVQTRVVAKSTDEGQGFGYVLSGTTADGAQFHSGVNGNGDGVATQGYDAGRETWGPSRCFYPNVDFPFYDKYKNCYVDYFKYAPAKVALRIAGGGTSFVPVSTTDTETAAAPAALSFLNRAGGCRRCQVSSPATSATYALGSSGAQPLKDPLFYAAKYGGFKEYQAGNDKPDLAVEWDAINNFTGASGSDGNPDNYFLVSNPLGLEDAMDRTFTSILAISSASSVATNSTSLNDNSRVYQARFNSRQWSGQVLSFVIDQSGKIADAPDWDAAQKMPAAANRKILTYNRDANGSGGLKGGVPFTVANLDTAMSTYLQAGGSATDLSDRVDYLRGSDAREGLGAGQFRRRPETSLGDIINSNPIFTGAPSAPYSDSSYASFKTTYRCRQPMLVVGANDGMLHVFGAERDPTLGCAGTDQKGVELLAFVPSFVDYKLPRLTQPNYIYDHRYFVDGTPAVADVYLPSKSSWRTVTVGTMGAGGQGIFALDITDPTQFSESNAANLVLWQFTDKDDADLGYTFSDVRIVKMNDGRWAAVFGNGYNNTTSCGTPPCAGNPEPERPDSKASSNGEGWLFIVFLDKSFGTSNEWKFDRGSNKFEYVKLPTRVGSTSNPNGLATPLAVDVNNDGTVDYIYAGDLQGNMWKFDVSSSDPGKWCAAWTTGSGQCDNRTPLPLYKARDNLNNAQPITAAPELMNHPNGGYLVYFGTGIYLRTSDRSTTGVSSFYGVWDKQQPTAGSTSDIGPSAGPVSGSVGQTARASTDPATQILLPRKWISSTAFGSGAEAGVEFRAMDPSPTTMDWSSYRGWYIDFKDSASGERMVYDPQIRNGKVIFTTLIPIDTATNPCLAGGTSWLTDVDALTGGPLSYPPFDVNGDRSFAVIPTNLFADYLSIGGTKYVPVSRKSQVGITPKPTIIAGKTQDKEFKVSSGSSGLLESVLENPGSISRKVVRRAWREVIRN